MSKTEAQKARIKRWNSSEGAKKAQKRWREKNRGKARKRSRELTPEQHEKKLAAQARWREKNRAHIDEYRRKRYMIVAVLEARLAAEDIGRRASEFVKDHFRRFSHYEFKSLDIEDAAVRMERIPATVEMWEHRA